ncbi:bifunctional metallophosphatase/5'-nucleotidase [Haloarchaeobius sp. TZWWS8]|uniref:bifunctional metallophosphatase/5'-nucleotidase n=1 Tax=Haloarchaeobius sp. TZWWS8 TaxID=3446121 RepID=UPI003EC0BBEB
MSLRLLHFADLEAAYDVPERVGRVVTAIETLRDESTVVTGGGDDTSPSVLSMATAGRQSLDFFEAVRPDVEVFGNHEFDHSPARAVELARESPQTWLNANVYEGDERFAAEVSTASTVVDTAAGRVGLFGLSPPELCAINPGLTFNVRDPVSVGTREAERLRREDDAEYVVAVSHCGDDTELAAAADVDVILGGHDHEPRDEVVAGTRLVRPGAAGRRLAEVRVEPDGTETRWHDVTEFDPDEAVTQTLDHRLEALGLDTVVTTVDGPLSRRVRDGESPVGTFVAESFRRAGDADVGLVNSMAMRDCGVPLDGRVTLADLHSLVPFDGGGLVTLSLSGRELRAVAREASAKHIDRDDLWNGQFAGLTMTWDAERETVDSLAVGDRPVDPEARYTLTTLRYLIVEDTEFPTLGESAVVAESGSLHEAMADCARQSGIPTQPVGWLTRSGESDTPETQR